MVIAVDAMGGDFAPAAVVEGAVLASQKIEHQIILVGRKQDIEPLLAGAKTPVRNIEIHDAQDVVTMDEQPAQAVRRKKNASLVVCGDLVKAGRAQAFVSAGNTGAGMAVALLIVGRIAGIDRPAIAALLPNRNGRTILLDAGANVDCEPSNLVQFAVMGNIYAQQMLGVAQPRVGLLNIGEEQGKGNEQAKESFHLLQQAPIQFMGNIEGPDLFNGRCDVAVCDGFVGNVVLKVSEGAAELFKNYIKDEFDRRPLLKAAIGPLLKPVLGGVARRTDYREVGGAPLLGVNGVCIISHGRSNATAIANAIRTAGEAASHGIVDRIRRQIAV